MAADLIVAIDVGMTSTGVIYWESSTSITKAIKWPKSNSAALIKTPTKLLYRSDGGLLQWGSNIPSPSGLGVRDDNTILAENWKRSLGKTNATGQKASGFYRDFLKSLYIEMSKPGFFPSPAMSGLSWHDRRVHVFFSIPTTWETNVVSETFRSLISQAGFGTLQNHTFDVTMTEPEAVAAHILCGGQSRPTGLKTGQRILVVDAGGATTDVCLLDITDHARGKVRSTQLHPVQGIDAGSVNIDEEFQTAIKPRLLPHKEALHCSVEDAAHAIAQSDIFQTAKLKVGGSRSADLRVSIKGLLRQAPNAWISVSKAELEGFFDQQLVKMKGLIFDSVDKVSQSYEKNSFQLDAIILAGGLGSSPYVQQKLREHCASGQHSWLRGTRVILAESPRLAVCYGLIHHAVTNPTVIEQRCSRASIGILRQIPAHSALFDIWKSMLHESDRWSSLVKKARRSGQPTIRDEYGKEWYTVIDWLIKTDHRGTSSPKAARFGAPRRPSSTPRPPPQIAAVSSKSLDRDPSPFPDKSTRHFTNKLTVDLSFLSDNDFRSKHKEWYKNVLRDRHYLQVHYAVELHIGMADCRIVCRTEDNTAQLSRLQILGLPSDEPTTAAHASE